MSIQSQAVAVGASVDGKIAGITPEIIIGIASILLNFLGQCWKSTPPAGSSNPSEYLHDHYNAETDEFEPSVIGQVRGQTRRAIRQHHRDNGGKRLKDYSQQEITEISTASLKQVMNESSVTAMSLAEIVI